MKYFFSLKLILVLFFVFSSYNVKAQWAFVNNGIAYGYENFTTTVATVFPYPNSYSGNIVIPNTVFQYDKLYTVTAIADIAFYNCDAISISIPDGVTSIGAHAFRECRNLTSLTIPNSVTSIGAYAFYSSTILKSINIPKDITSIETFTFSLCVSLRSITIPSNVTKIGKYAFDHTSLDSIISLNPEPPDTDSTAFTNMYPGCKLYVPLGSKAKYAAAVAWKQFSDIEELIPVSVKNTAPNAVEVYAEANSVVIKGASIGQNIGVYNVSGMQIKLIQAQSNIVKLELPKNQIYIVRIGQTSHKVEL